MALTKFEKDMAIISALDDEPNDVGGLTAAELKAKFDEGGMALKEFVNQTLLPEAEQTFAAKEELEGLVLGQLPDGSVTREKISEELDETLSALETNVAKAVQRDEIYTKTQHLSDTTRALFGLGSSATPDQVFQKALPAADALSTETANSIGVTFRSTSFTPSVSTTNQRKHFAYGNGVYVFIAGVYDKFSGSNVCAAYSPDGKTWTELDTVPTITSSIHTVVFGAGTFFAYTNNEVLTSTDGQTWAVQTPSGHMSDLKSVAYSSGHNIFVAVRDNNTKPCYSTDGLNWTVATTGANYGYDVVHNGARFMYITRSSSGYFSYSTNGIDWTDKTNTTLFTGDRWHIAARGTRLIAVSETAGKKKGTASSTAWSAISDSTGLGTGFRGIASTGNQTVALPVAGLGLAEYSPNYTAWSFIAYPYNVSGSLNGQTIFGEHNAFLIYNGSSYPVLYANAVSTPNDVLYGLNSKINYLISGLHELEDAIESA